MALSAFGVEDSRLVSKAGWADATKFLRPLKEVGPTLKAMPGGIKTAYKGAAPGFGSKAKAVLGVKGVPQTLGAAAAVPVVGGIAALGNGRRNNKPVY